MHGAPTGAFGPGLMTLWSIWLGVFT
jgi:hypothetical protein